MATIKDVTIRFNTDTKQLLESEKLFDKVNDAIKEQSGAINQLREQERQLIKLRNQSTDPKQIETYNKELARTAEQQKKLTQTTKETAKGMESFNDSLKDIALSIGLAFSVDAVVEFGKESVKAFQEAELNAKKLEFAVRSIGGENGEAFKKLIEQSEKLQENGIFSDDAIQQAQTALLQYGLTSDQIEKLIPQITDLASATGMDLAQATDKVILAVNGQTKGLRDAGIAFTDTGSKTKNLAELSEQLAKFQGSTALALETSAGKAQNLANRFDDLKENVGEFLVGSGSGFLDFLQQAFDPTGYAMDKGAQAAKKATADTINAINEEINSLDDKALSERYKKVVAYLELLRSGKSQLKGKELADEVKFNEKFLQLAQIRIKTLQEKESDLTLKGQADKEAAHKKELDRIAKEEKEKADLKEWFRLKEQETRNKEAEDTVKITDETNKMLLGISDDYTKGKAKQGEEAGAAALKAKEAQLAEEAKLEQQYAELKKTFEQDYYDAKINAALAFSNSFKQLAGDNAALQNTFLIFEKGIAIADVIVKASQATAAATAAAAAAAIPTAGASMAALPGLIGIINGSAALNIATIVATAIPQLKFAKGVIDLQGAGSETSDSIPAYLSKGESVMTAEETRQHKGLFESIRKDRFDTFLNENYIMPKLKDSAINGSFADNVARNYNTLDEYGVARAFRRGTVIRNADEIGKSVARNLGSNMETKLLKRNGII